MHSTMKIYILISSAIFVIAIILLLLMPLIFPSIFKIALALDTASLINPRSFTTTIALVLLIGFLPVLVIGSTLYAYIDGLLSKKNGIGDSVHAK
ncbi:hypothetical protein A3C86_03400 [Candidatus Kaiserbacteria bacterium RIFCSPHIGHO2_02_FULL_49_16]|uniref:Uncharacterized protein n=1 Tax=Candidatus Kaiserbacteria bacterium RIFCSPHIGHO2_02_FULL_49_16 TaxID=1798490 RepID=A0A1F6DBG2_9BACT|nr:MAG: hypothetical protein A3C86_03400 [Candidatus Kaiserbacteria bacterium RIFCSPHIGHO2_02_FULL_49_16]